MSEWKTYKLGEISEIIGGGTPSTSNGEYWNGDINWLTPRDLTNNKLRHIKSGERNLSKIGLKNSSARLMPKGTILMTSRAPIGYLAIAQNEICTNQGFKNFIVDSAKINNEFFYYLLMNNIEYIKSLGTGTTFAEVSGSILKNLRLKFPNLSTQQQIAIILSSLDNKIELNLQMNQTLEAMAQALFKEWFVDKADDNWATVNLRDLIEIKGGYSYKGKDVGTGDAFLLGMGCVSFNERFLPSGARPYPEESTNNHFVNPGDIVLATRQQSDNLPILGFPARIPSTFNNKKVIVGTNLYRVINNSKINESILFQLFRSDSYRHHIIANSKGTTVRMITKDSVELFEFKIPPIELVQEYGKILERMDRKIEENTIQIQTLTQTRDILLPKLMSGEIKVS